MMERGRSAKRQGRAVQGGHAALVEGLQPVTVAIVDDARMPGGDGAVGKDDVVGDAAPQGRFGAEEIVVHIVSVSSEDDARSAVAYHAGGRRAAAQLLLPSCRCAAISSLCAPSCVCRRARGVLQ